MKRWTVLLLTLTLLAVGCARREVTFVTIGTGGVTGVYYPTGGAISRMINLKYDEYKIKATVESTSGSVFNINGVVSGDLEFGVTQSDRQYQAYNGLAEWSESGSQENLRSVFAIHPESITLVAADESGIETIADLRGKRVNLGNPGSGQLQNSRDVRIKVRIIDLTGAGIDEMVDELPYYARSTIPVEFYPRAVNQENIETVGVKATFVTSMNVPDNVVYAITREVFEHLEEFKDLHPAYQVLTKENMLEGLSAPIHPGALRYYREAGLMAPE